MKIIELNENNFENEISNELIMVEFYANDCAICQSITNEMEEIASNADFKVGRVDVDQNPALETRFEILSIPTIIFFKKGELVHEIIGFPKKEDLYSIASSL